MIMVRLNVLPLIAAWLDSEPVTGISRDAIVRWVRHHEWEAALQGEFTEEHVQLATDCLIAAGFGREAEQDGAVYGFYSYAEPLKQAPDNMPIDLSVQEILDREG